MNFEIIKRNYEQGLWNVEMVRLALEKKVITQTQYNEIVNSNARIFN